jgi:hypothetical protein
MSWFSRKRPAKKFSGLDTRGVMQMQSFNDYLKMLDREHGEGTAALYIETLRRNADDEVG